jgi:hypothetical protein
MSAEEKLVRHGYMKLMRYQSAAAAEDAASRGSKARPGDYVSFGITILAEGPLPLVLAKPVAELVTPRGGEVLVATPRHRGEKGFQHVSYALAWKTAPAADTGREQGTLQELIAANPRYRGATRYTAYRVTVRLGRTTRTYRALALHRGSPVWPDVSLTELVDRVTPLVTDVLREQSPAIRSPWDAYVKSRFYRAIDRALRQAPARGAAAQPASTPLGFVPGDDILSPPQDNCPECQICVEGECLGDPFQDGMQCGGDICKQCHDGDCNEITEQNPPFGGAVGTARVGPSRALGACSWGLTWPEAVLADIDARCDNGQWTAVLTGLTGNYSQQVRLLPAEVEVTGPGGNTTQANFCPQVTELNALGFCPGAWYMLGAVQAHEDVHLAHFQPELSGLSGQIERAIEAISAPKVAGETRAQGVAKLRATAAFANALAQAQQDWLNRLLADGAADHGGPTAAAEHGVVDPMVANICTFAKAHAWGACGVCPP